MYVHKLPRPITRGVSVTLEILGGNWKPRPVHNIRQGLRRRSELHRLNQGTARRVLNQQLRELEVDGVVRQVVHPVLPPKAE